jgi:glycosyltransferase involved in cell wall biosynthesis
MTGEKQVRPLVFCVTHFAPHVGGVETYVSEIGQRLAAAGERVYILCLNTAGGPEREVIHGMEVVRVPVLCTLAGIVAVPRPGAWKAALREIGALKPRCIITHTRFFVTSFEGMRAARRLHAPHLHTEHGGGPVVHHSPIVRFGSWLMDVTLGKRVLRMADAITVVSNAGGAFVNQLSGRTDWKLVPNGIDAGFWRRTTQYSLSQPPVVFTAMRLVRAKGVIELIQAMQMLPSEWKVRIAGAGEGLDSFVALAAELGVADRIEWLGKLDRKQIRAELERCSLFVHPSHSEGMPTAVLEALAMGVPTVATAVGGTGQITEMCPQISRLIAPHDAPALASAMAEMSETLADLTATEQAEQSEAAAARIRDAYDWDTVAALYAEAIGALTKAAR